RFSAALVGTSGPVGCSPAPSARGASPGCPGPSRLHRAATYSLGVLIVCPPRIRDGIGPPPGSYFAAPIRIIVVPHTGHLPFIAGLPFFSLTATAPLISRLARHFTQ